MNPLNRPLPKYLQTGEPNLIVCPQSKVNISISYIYYDVKICYI